MEEAKLRFEASTILGRDVEVEKTKDGKYVVLYMSLESSPPPKGDTIKEALENFIKWYEDKTPVILPDVEPMEETFDRDF